LAIIGPSAAGKTSLAKVIAGIWPPARGEIRLGGATYDQWEPEMFGRFIGYVPQSVDLLNGTVGQNICRFDPEALSEAIVAAAKAAGMHETILAMPNGYDSPVSSSGGEISAGQRQRLGLARALYGDPYVVVLDEANSNLDSDGDAALAKAIEDIKARHAIAVMITHRPATLGPVTHVAFINNGRLAEIGPRDEVLTKLGMSTGTNPSPKAVKVEAGAL
jgi:ATP-binding cassette subfamily C protein